MLTSEILLSTRRPLGLFYLLLFLLRFFRFIRTKGTSWREFCTIYIPRLKLTTSAHWTLLTGKIGKRPHILGSECNQNHYLYTHETKLFTKKNLSENNIGLCWWKNIYLRKKVPLYCTWIYQINQTMYTSPWLITTHDNLHIYFHKKTTYAKNISQSLNNVFLTVFLLEWIDCFFLFLFLCFIFLHSFEWTEQ